MVCLLNSRLTKPKLCYLYKCIIGVRTNIFTYCKQTNIELGTDGISVSSDSFRVKIGTQHSYCKSEAEISMGGKKGVVRKGDREGWEPRYGNDSRPWLLGFSEDVPMPTTSTTQQTYTAEWPPKPRAEGIRRQLLKKALWQQARQEVEAQLTATEVADEEPATEYTECFIKEGFTADPIQTDPELHRKYPLYGDAAVSLWGEKFPALPGATRSPYIRHQFRRYAGFTKPLDETFDESVDLK